MAAVAVILILVLAFAFWWMKSRQRKPVSRRVHKAAVRKKVSSHPYAAVRVEGEEGCCAAMTALEGEVWLSADAPPLPLPDCDRSGCHCHYIHLDDRRQNEARRNPYVPVDVSVYDGDKVERKGRGRRSTDR